MQDMMYGTSRLHRFPSSAHLRPPCWHLPSPFFHLPPQTMFVLLLFKLFYYYYYFILNLAASLASSCTPSAKSFGHGLWHLKNLQVLPETWKLSQTHRKISRTTEHLPYPSSSVIFSCKTKTFQTVLSKYGKSFIQSMQKVHLSMVCNT